MKTAFFLCLFATGLLFCAADIAKAQDTAKSQQSASNYAPYNPGVTAEQASSQTRVLAGCLMKGAAANAYTLHGEGLNSWALTSDSVDLSEYVDQKVRVTILNKPASDGSYFVTDVSWTMATCMR